MIHQDWIWRKWFCCESFTYVHNVISMTPIPNYVTIWVLYFFSISWKGMDTGIGDRTNYICRTRAQSRRAESKWTNKDERKPELLEPLHHTHTHTNYQLNFIITKPSHCSDFRKRKPYLRQAETKRRIWTENRKINMRKADSIKREIFINDLNLKRFYNLVHVVCSTVIGRGSS